ncbi:hypothetical protein Cp1R7AA1_031 [Mesorhizobium phage Cp1R7A-A1]|nr:hypothetical protein Cp1R7AA1_031 [Mesorhizobium phage Cp1R7A-A1]
MKLPIAKTEIAKKRRPGNGLLPGLRKLAKADIDSVDLTVSAFLPIDFVPLSGRLRIACRCSHGDLPRYDFLARARREEIRFSVAQAMPAREIAFASALSAPAHAARPM